MSKPPRQDLALRSRHYSVRVLKHVQGLRESGKIPRRVVDQLAAAATAIGANLSEAAVSLTRRQMTQCYIVAAREAREALYWLDVVRQVDDIDPTESLWLLKETDEFVAILTVSVRNLRFPQSSP